ncbi:Hsp20/alpha crystallin family protein [Candidatus Bathyarchaeota archaeon]|nr:Hsp20/alpha crystallin family protein [Candidatus Bathyarchaeota archaeon]
MAWWRRKMFEQIEALEREIGEAFEEFFYERPMWDIKTGRIKPLTYVTEAEDKIVVTADLPFVRKENIKLNVSEDTLEIEAAMERCVRFERWGTVQRSCEFKSFHRIIKLPSEVVPEEAKAKFKCGILTIDLPKKVKGYKIEIE